MASSNVADAFAVQFGNCGLGGILAMPQEAEDVLNTNASAILHCKLIETKKIERKQPRFVFLYLIL